MQSDALEQFVVWHLLGRTTSSDGPVLLRAQTHIIWYVAALKVGMLIGIENSKLGILLSKHDLACCTIYMS